MASRNCGSFSGLLDTGVIPFRRRRFPPQWASQSLFQTPTQCRRSGHQFNIVSNLSAPRRTGCTPCRVLHRSNQECSPPALETNTFLAVKICDGSGAGSTSFRFCALKPRTATHAIAKATLAKPRFMVFGIAPPISTYWGRTCGMRSYERTKRILA